MALCALTIQSRGRPDKKAKVIMKTRLFIIAFFTAALCFYSCEKTSSDDQTTNASSDEKTNPDGGTANGSNDDETIDLPELPKLEDVDDVCTKMKDIYFMSYCYDNFDANHDSKVSMVEAAAVSSISCSTATDFTGIEYFSGLKSFASNSVETIDLRYNTELTSIEVGYSNIERLDLSYNLNLTAIGEDAFRECASLASIELPSTLTRIGNSAFYKCTSLTHIDLPEGLTYIGDFTEHANTFRGCTSLTSINLPSGLIYISTDVFRECTSLTYIDLPSSLILIDEHAFYKCSSLHTVLSNAIAPPAIWYPFYEIDDSAVLYVPSESVEAYKNSDWADYFTEILPL